MIFVKEAISHLVLSSLDAKIWLSAIIHQAFAET